MPGLLFSQARIVFQGGNISLRNNATLVLTNPAPDALTVSGSGGITSEAAGNSVLWYIGNQSATYQIPFTVGGTAIPVSFTTNGGSADGHFIVSTYAGSNWQNSNYLPPKVTNVNQQSVDNSNHVIDRFWQINAAGYHTAPALSDILFSYRDNEWSATGNQITEADLVAQNWNDITNVWMDPAPGTENPALNHFTLPNPVPSVTFPWWTLVSGDFPLPLTLLSFDVAKQGDAATLQWLVTQQVNVDHFDIQRSTDAVHFTSIGDVPAIASNSPTIPYQYTDRLPGSPAGIVYYRLQMIDQDGKFSFSPVKFISFDNGPAPLLQCFPNPVTNLAILRFGSVPPGHYLVKLYTSSGMQVSAADLAVSPNATCYLPRDPRIMPGMYVMSVTGSGFSQSFLVQYR